jgi:arylsulfatase A-like enzyme
MNGGRSAGVAPRRHGIGVPWTGKRLRTAALAALALAIGLLTIASPATAQDRPNILLIVTDDQRADGTMDVMPKTLQWFEAGGTKYPQAFSTTPVCCPARASIFSGQYTHNHGVRSNDLANVLDQRFTIQAYLKAAGYKTGIFGKYFNAWNLFQNPPNFDDFAIATAGYTPIRVNERGTVKTVTQYATSYIRDNAVRFIEESELQDATPWFLDLSTTAPHAPFTPDTAYQNAGVSPFTPPPTETDKRDKPPYVQLSTVDMASVESERANQLRTLMSVDDMVQTVFETLEATGETSNTLAIFISDNGFLWGEHGLRAKGVAYDPAVRVPLFVRWPGHVIADATDSRLVANIDIAPTIVQAVGGIAPMVPMDGRSLLDPLQNRTRLLTDDLGWAALRTATSLYIEHYDSSDEDRIVHREYYDLVADPFELENLLADGNPANDPPTAALSAQLAADRDCTGNACP